MNQNKKEIYIQNRIRILTHKINDALRLKKIFSIIAGSTAFITCVVLIIYGMMVENSGLKLFLFMAFICIILCSAFVFSIVVININDTKLAKWCNERHYLITRAEHIRTEFEIANAFAHCYWNAFADIEELTEEKIDTNLIVKNRVLIDFDAIYKNKDEEIVIDD